VSSSKGSNALEYKSVSEFIAPFHDLEGLSYIKSMCSAINTLPLSGA
jgi:hypothetical protein